MTVREAAGAVRERAGEHDVAVVLGSGWAAVADGLGEPVWEAPVRELPGFPVPTALGHGGIVRSVRRGRLRVLVLLGRAHLYEGHPVEVVTHGVRTAVVAGCRTVVLTNAAGGITADRYVGEPVLISDHLDLTRPAGTTGDHPHLTRPPGTTDDHPDPSGRPGPGRLRGGVAVGGSPYSAALRKLARRVEPGLRDGVYAGLTGPHFETPAEIRMLRTLGADLVGMSTVLEAVAARAAGADVLGIALVSNLAAGVSPTPLSADEVMAAGRAALPRLTALLAGVLDQLSSGMPGSGARNAHPA